MGKKNYKSKGEKFFIDFVPKEVFEGMTKEERKFYKLYRDNHKHIKVGNDRIENCKKEIEKQKEIIKKTKSQIKGSIESKGWKDKMLEGYSHISHLSKSFEFWCSVEKRKRKSQSLIDKERGYKKRVSRQHQSTFDYDNKDDKGKKTILSKNYKEWDESRVEITPSEKPMKVHIKYYIRVESKLKGEWNKTFYLGSEDMVREFLKNVLPNQKDWNKEDGEVLKSHIKDIYIGYTRYHIHKTNPLEFCKGEKKHSSDEVVNWSKKMGEEIFDWMDH